MSIGKVLQHKDIIADVAKRHAIPATLLMAICYMESGGDPEAYNEETMATGLFQISPKERGKPYHNRPTVKALKDPATNADWAATLLNMYTKIQGNSFEWGLFRFTGGVGKWFPYVSPAVAAPFDDHSNMTQLRRVSLAWREFITHYWEPLREIQRTIVDALMGHPSPELVPIESDDDSEEVLGVKAKW